MVHELTFLEDKFDAPGILGEECQDNHKAFPSYLKLYLAGDYLHLEVLALFLLL